MIKPEDVKEVSIQAEFDIACAEIDEGLIKTKGSYTWDYRGNTRLRDKVGNAYLQEGWFVVEFDDEDIQPYDPGYLFITNDKNYKPRPNN